MNHAGQAEMRRRFSVNLRDLRVDRGYTQEKLAFRAGLDRTAISLWECADRLPSFEPLIRLAGALDASITDLTAGIEFRPIVAIGGGIRIGHA
jgi:transcriptional regulator with XRE-family HTH domain